MKKIILITFILLFSTAHATPISDIDVVRDFPEDILGGNIYNLAAEYNSESIFVVYHFQFESPYPLENNTPEMPYFVLSVDDLTLNHTRIHHNNTLSIYSNNTLTQGRHNTTVYFALAHNIYPSKYTFLFEMITEDVQESIVTYRGSSSSRRSNPRTKTCTFEVVPQFEPPENHTEILPVENITVPEEIIPENITNTTKYVFQTTAEALNSTQTDEDIECKYGYVLLFVLLIAFSLLFGWFDYLETKNS